MDVSLNNDSIASELVQIFLQLKLVTTNTGFTPHREVAKKCGARWRIFYIETVGRNVRGK